MKRQAFLFLIFIILALPLLSPAQGTPGRPMKVKVTAEQANLREKPDIGSGIVQQIAEGTVLEADRKEGEWFFVRYALEDGGVIGGYIHESLVEVIEQAAAPAPAGKTPERETSRGERVPASRRANSPGLDAPHLEFSVSAGAGWVAPRDLNDGARGLADYNAASLGLPISGPVGSLHMVAAAGVELSYRISRWLAVGLGADYLRGGNRSRVEYTDTAFSETLDTRPLVSVVPVRLGVRFYPGRGFYIRGALGVYFVKAGYLYRLEREESWQEWKGAAKARRFGAEAAFGGDWKIGANTSFFVEAGFRMASLGGLSGRDVYRNSAGDTLTEEGLLYFFRKEGADSRAYPLLFVRAVRPTGETEAGVIDSRQAEINISGTAVRAGLRFRF
jgi:hypothetical protein